MVRPAMEREPRTQRMPMRMARFGLGENVLRTNLGKTFDMETEEGSMGWRDHTEVDLLFHHHIHHSLLPRGWGKQVRRRSSV